MYIFLDRQLCRNNVVLPILNALKHSTMKKTFNFRVHFSAALPHIHFYNYFTLLIIHKVMKANVSSILHCTPKYRRVFFWKSKTGILAASAIFVMIPSREHGEVNHVFLLCFYHKTCRSKHMIMRCTL